MRRLKRWLLPLLTLLLIAAGAGMPWAAARFQDRYGIAVQEVLPFDPVSLTLRKDSEIGSILRLMGNIREQAGWFGETNLDEADACMAALDALAALDRCELLRSGYIDPYGSMEKGILDRLKAAGESSAMPMLCIAEDGSSAVIWYCCWGGNACPSYELLIDDTTALAVNGYIPCPHSDGQETDRQRVEQWVRFFHDYYGITIMEINDRSHDTLPRFLFRFDPEDGQGELGLLVRMYSFEMDFYPCSASELLSSSPEDSVTFSFSEREQNLMPD